MRISNKEARQYVQCTVPFTASNLYAEWASPSLYVVYSFGQHFPLFVFDKTVSTWYENSDKYSMTTSRHKSQSRPYAIRPIISDTEKLRLLIAKGSTAAAISSRCAYKEASNVIEHA